MARPKGATNRRSAGRSASQQNTLAFSAKITKPAAAQAQLGKAAKAGKPITEASAPRTAKIAAEPAPASPLPAAEPETASLKPQARPTQLSDDEQRAAQVSEEQVAAYWRQKEDSRIFPRGESDVRVCLGEC